MDAGSMNHMNELLDLLKSEHVNLAERKDFDNAWDLTGTFLQEKPVMTKADLDKMDSDGAVLLRFGSRIVTKIEEDKALEVTPWQRTIGHEEPLNTMADYVLLAVARQLTLLKRTVSAVHSFEKLYGGRLLTEPGTCFRQCLLDETVIFLMGTLGSQSREIAVLRLKCSKVRFYSLVSSQNAWQATYTT